jgi:hypothetical protein
VFTIQSDMETLLARTETNPKLASLESRVSFMADEDAVDALAFLDTDEGRLANCCRCEVYAFVCVRFCMCALRTVSCAVVCAGCRLRMLHACLHQWTQCRLLKNMVDG